MSTQTKEVYIGDYEVGTTILIPVDFVKNSGSNIATGVEVEVDYPATLSYNSGSTALDQGSYSDITKIWSIGSLLQAQSVAAVFAFDIVDDCESSYTITFTVSTQSGCDSCLNDNELCVTTTGSSCCLSAGCRDWAIDTVTDLAYNVLLTDEILLLDGSSNDVVATLPSAASAYDSTTGKSKRFIFKAINVSNAVSLSATEKIVAATTVAGAGTTYSFSSVGDAAIVVTDGTNYFVIATA